MLCLAGDVGFIWTNRAFASAFPCWRRDDGCATSSRPVENLKSSYEPLSPYAVSGAVSDALFVAAAR